MSRGVPRNCALNDFRSSTDFLKNDDVVLGEKASDLRVLRLCHGGKVVQEGAGVP